MRSYTSTERPRRSVGRVSLALLSPLFKYSMRRDAYVLRGVGRRFGPVLVLRGARSGPVMVPPVFAQPALDDAVVGVERPADERLAG